MRTIPHVPHLNMRNNKLKIAAEANLRPRIQVLQCSVNHKQASTTEILK